MSRNIADSVINNVCRYKKGIIIPTNVTILVENDSVLVQGKLGNLTHVLNKFVRIKLNSLKSLDIYAKSNDDINMKCLIGTTRSVINGMIVGVTLGFVRKLQLVGIGYRVSIDSESILSFIIGLSHPVYYKLPVGINAKCLNQTEIILTGIDKQLIGQVAADLRAIRPPEPFKGKGIRYSNELVYHKETKKK